MPEQCCQIIERVDLIQLAGVDQAHEEIARPRSIHRLVEERILTMEDGFLQHSFGNVVVEGRPCLPQEQCQCAPQTDSSATGADRPSPARCSTDETSAFPPA